MVSKTFDALEFQHAAGEAIQAVLDGMTREEELAYWQAANERAREYRQRLQKEPASVSGSRR